MISFRMFFCFHISCLPFQLLQSLDFRRPHSISQPSKCFCLKAFVLFPPPGTFSLSSTFSRLLIFQQAQLIYYLLRDTFSEHSISNSTTIHQGFLTLFSPIIVPNTIILNTCSLTFYYLSFYLGRPSCSI